MPGQRPRPPAPPRRPPRREAALRARPACPRPRRGRGPALPRGRRAVRAKFDGKWAPAGGQAVRAEAGTALLTAASRDERQRLGEAPTSSVSPRIAVKRARPAAGEGNRNPPPKGRRDPKPGRRRGPHQPDSRQEPWREQGAEGRSPPPRPGYLQPLGVTGDVPRDAAQRQPVTVHGAPRAGALRRARLRRHRARHRQQQPQGQGELPPAAHHHRPLQPSRAHRPRPRGGAGRAALLLAAGSARATFRVRRQRSLFYPKPSEENNPGKVRRVAPVHGWRQLRWARGRARAVPR